MKKFQLAQNRQKETGYRSQYVYEESGVVLITKKNINYKWSGRIKLYFTRDRSERNQNSRRVQRCRSEKIISKTTLTAECKRI